MIEPSKLYWNAVGTDFQVILYAKYFIIIISFSAAGKCDQLAEGLLGGP